jgi:hypothetical protein
MQSYVEAKRLGRIRDAITVTRGERFAVEMLEPMATGQTDRWPDYTSILRCRGME